jgi:2-polyprenyl-3-methyl-5-hydroxy-6-metoxy-1,4-benzoquinol methylase
MVQHNLKALLETYEGHPLTEEALMRRLAARAAPPTEFDLAIDRDFELTDQNHIGGFAATIALAEAAQIRANDAIVDLGCGLGGPARVLAQIYGCRVHGIDANPERIEQARSLSKLVGLDTLVSFDVGDVNTFASDDRFSVLWAQNAWIHFAEPTLFSASARGLLHPRARIAFEDVCLIRECSTDGERDAVARLCEAWNCRFRSPNEWAGGIRGAGFEVRSIQDARPTMISYLERISRLAESPNHRVPLHEIMGWNLGLQLAREGLLSYIGIVGVRE